MGSMGVSKVSRKRISRFVHNIYLRSRKSIPERHLSTLKRSDLFMLLVRRMQPPQNNPEIYNLERPLKGHSMRIPLTNVYPMVWGRYEPDVCRAIADIVKPGWTALDIGAHIGYHTLLLAKQVGKNGQVIAFEPLEETRKFLEENVSLNGCDENVRIEPMAVAERTRLLKLHHFMDRCQAFLEGCDQEVSTNEGDVIVPVCSLDDYFGLLDWPPVHFIKMDIEGAESRAIIGMREVIKRNHPIFLIESHGEQAREGLSLLRQEGYKAYRLTKNGLPDADDFSKPIVNEHWILTHDAE